MGRTIDITLDTCFKEFVEKVRGIRFVDVVQGTPLYRDLLREFNQSKRIYLDDEDREERRRARMIAMAEEGGIRL
jgi:hypothetical protein